MFYWRFLFFSKCSAFLRKIFWLYDTYNFDSFPIIYLSLTIL